MSSNKYMMLSLAWRNIWRNKRRTLITTASVVFAVLLAVLLNSLKEGILVKMQDNAVSFYSGAVQIQHKSYWDERTIDNSFEEHDSIVDVLIKNTLISDFAPRLESFGLASSGERSKGILVIGVDPIKESKLTKLNNKLVQGKFFTAEDNSVLISRGLSDYLKLNIQDTVVIIGQGYHGQSAAGKYAVGGIIKMASPDLDKRLIYMPLKLCQSLYGAYGRISSIAVNAKDVTKAEKVSSALAPHLSQLAVLNWKQLMPELDQMIESERAENVVFLFVLYLLISFGIFGTILMMLMERKFEFGVLLAIGMKKFKLWRIVLMENIFITVLGAVVGTLLSIPIILYLYKFPIEVGGKLKEAYENFGFEPIFYFSIEPKIFYSQTLVVLAIALLLSLYPIFKISRMDALDAMRS